ncbi:MAG: hypothetical protein UW07_C0039G0025 [Candidatus Nomurabacteria bacterium GW2011_GWF2_43_8]|uniref:Uncharacterized protein n=3 Tax=Candidatus Nomuraibacteriota TaxID=1752729 RepID=A0A0G1HRU6_9BACT|nr:MAG: hypothetical protein UV76_C0001G0007 [Candidatus Nomurabacteria bacterium GW2011_GWA2_43_15]KKT19283.1 MAG: hypothetical protein UW02_C0012G0014 [Candidatus Nomurabacteria bacterium GW2011_GWB1_43_7]KKT22317.1 MAG: hypothetical protein UW07_C0039G0025 [Candidatus Nomurabacteria bacterium GW2011_GWF2_43_8]
MEGVSAGNNIEIKGNDWILHTGLDILPPAEKELSRRLRKAGWSEIEVYRMAYGFHEILINAIAHGNLEVSKKKEDDNLGELIKAELDAHPEKKNKKILVHVEVSPERVFIRIEDQGLGFSNKILEDSKTEENMVKTHRRGIKTTAPIFEFGHDEGSNVVTLVKMKEQA